MVLLSLQQDHSNNIQHVLMPRYWLGDDVALILFSVDKIASRFLPHDPLWLSLIQAVIIHATFPVYKRKTIHARAQHMNMNLITIHWKIASGGIIICLSLEIAVFPAESKASDWWVWECTHATSGGED